LIERIDLVAPSKAQLVRCLNYIFGDGHTRPGPSTSISHVLTKYIKTLISSHASQ
jgi:hypothetical protein